MKSPSTSQRKDPTTRPQKTSEGLQKQMTEEGEEVVTKQEVKGEGGRVGGWGGMMEGIGLDSHFEHTHTPQ